jgi:hypothetical protein
MIVIGDNRIMSGGRLIDIRDSMEVNGDRLIVTKDRQVIVTGDNRIVPKDIKI